MAPIQWNATDIDVGARLVTILAEHAATHGTVISVPDLLALARKAHPRDGLLARSVPLGIVPKLQFVTAFCAQYGYPDLVRLVTGTPPVDDAVPNWSINADAIPASLAAFAAAAHAAVPKRFKPRAERPADVAWYAFFRSHRPACAAVSASGKQEIINLIMAGLDPEAALVRVLSAQEAQAF